MKAQLRITDAECLAGLPTRQSVERARDLFLQEGFVWLENLFPRAFVTGLSEAWFAGHGALDDDSLSRCGLVVGERRVMVPLPLAAPFDSPRFYAHPILMVLLNLLLGEEFVLSSASVIVALAGAPAQRMHRDDALPFGFSEASARVPPIAITVAIPFVDLSLKTGSTAIYPGSHQVLRSADSFCDGQVLPLPQLGDAYLMDYRLAHGGTPNRSHQRRPVVYLIYCRPWYLDARNHLDQGLPAVIYDPAKLRQLPTPLAQLLSRARLIWS